MQPRLMGVDGGLDAVPKLCVPTNCDVSRVPSGISNADDLRPWLLFLLADPRGGSRTRPGF
jgi:hypothetical protein